MKSGPPKQRAIFFVPKFSGLKKISYIYYMMQNTQYVNILEDGTVINTSWKREPGERVAKPGGRAGQTVQVKYSLTRAAYNQCLENRKELVDKYFRKKAIVINEGRGFPDDRKIALLKDLFNEVKDEPLMAETFFISMTHFT